MQRCKGCNAERSFCMPCEYLAFQEEDAEEYGDLYMEVADLWLELYCSADALPYLQAGTPLLRKPSLPAC